MILVFPGDYKLDKGDSVPVFWHGTSEQVRIGKAKLTLGVHRLRADITFNDEILPKGVMESIQDNPNAWAIGTIDDKVRYLSAMPPLKLQPDR